MSHYFIKSPSSKDPRPWESSVLNSRDRPGGSPGPVAPVPWCALHMSVACALCIQVCVSGIEFYLVFSILKAPKA